MPVRLFSRKDDDDEAARRRADASAVLVTVSSFTLRRPVPIADVGSLKDLVKLAEKYESMVMENVSSGGTTYVVWDNGMIYRYITGSPDTSVPDFAGTSDTAWGGRSDEPLEPLEALARGRRRREQER